MKSINSKWYYTNGLNEWVDHKFIKGFRKSELAGDTAYHLMAVDEYKMEALLCRFKNYKRNNTVQFEYPDEVVWEKKLRQWRKEH